MLIEIFPLRSANLFGASQNFGLVVVIDPQHPAQGRAELCQELWRLTPTEARLAEALSDGETVSGFARREGMAPGTARWHLKTLQQKTATNSTAALVALVRASLPPFFPPPLRGSSPFASSPPMWEGRAGKRSATLVLPATDAVNIKDFAGDIMTRFILSTMLSMTFLSPVATLAEGTRSGPVSGMAAGALAPDVQASIAELRKHGARFEKAIRQIEAEARKPNWSPTADCDHQIDFEDSAPST